MTDVVVSYANVIYVLYSKDYCKGGSGAKVSTLVNPSQSNKIILGQRFAERWLFVNSTRVSNRVTAPHVPDEQVSLFIHVGAHGFCSGTKKSSDFDDHVPKSPLPIRQSR